MPTADEISRSIEPGSTEYGDRQVLQDRMAQISAQTGGQAPPPATPAPAMSKLASGGVSELPVTDGMSVGPGAGPATAANPAESPLIERYRLIATTARNPQLRQLARKQIEILLNQGA